KAAAKAAAKAATAAIGKRQAAAKAATTSLTEALSQGIGVQQYWNALMTNPETDSSIKILKAVDQLKPEIKNALKAELKKHAASWIQATAKATTNNKGRFSKTFSLENTQKIEQILSIIYQQDLVGDTETDLKDNVGRIGRALYIAQYAGLVQLKQPTIIDKMGETKKIKHNEESPEEYDKAVGLIYEDIKAACKKTPANSLEIDLRSKLKDDLQTTTSDGKSYLKESIMRAQLEKATLPTMFNTGSYGSLSSRQDTIASKAAAKKIFSGAIDPAYPDMLTEPKEFAAQGLLLEQKEVESIAKEALTSKFEEALNSNSDQLKSLLTQIGKIQKEMDAAATLGETPEALKKANDARKTLQKLLDTEYFIKYLDSMQTTYKLYATLEGNSGFSRDAALRNFLEKNSSITARIWNAFCLVYNTLAQRTGLAQPIKSPKDYLVALVADQERISIALSANHTKLDSDIKLKLAHNAFTRNEHGDIDYAKQINDALSASLINGQPKDLESMQTFFKNQTTGDSFDKIARNYFATHAQQIVTETLDKGKGDLENVLNILDTETRKSVEKSLLAEIKNMSVTVFQEDSNKRVANLANLFTCMKTVQSSEYVDFIKNLTKSSYDLLLGDINNDQKFSDIPMQIHAKLDEGLTEDECAEVAQLIKDLNHSACFTALLQNFFVTDKLVANKARNIRDHIGKTPTDSEKMTMALDEALKTMRTTIKGGRKKAWRGGDDPVVKAKREFMNIFLESLSFSTKRMIANEGHQAAFKALLSNERYAQLANQYLSEHPLKKNSKAYQFLQDIKPDLLDPTGVQHHIILSLTGVNSKKDPLKKNRPSNGI
ncbi:hypothetical protein EBR43_02995, partial [bacterium]|nr:hypothetical protein [bacterium]